MRGPTSITGEISSGRTVPLDVFDNAIQCEALSYAVLLAVTVADEKL